MGKLVYFYICGFLQNWILLLIKKLNAKPVSIAYTEKCSLLRVRIKK